MSFLTLLFLVVFLIVGPCIPQDLDPIVSLRVTLEAIGQNQDMILQRLDEMERNMDTQQQELENKLGFIEEEIQKCATHVEIDAFKTMFTTEQEDMKNSLQQCFTKDQITTVQHHIEEDCQPELNKTRKVLLDITNFGMDNLTFETQKILSEFLEQKEAQCERKPINGSNCKELMDNGETESGVYTITPKGFPDGVEVYCDMETDGGGWSIIFQRKQQIPQLNFVRTFEEYANGFGDPNGEIWIGNRILHSMTGDQPFTLRVDAKNLEGESRTGIWHTFSVGSQDTQFTLSVADYSSSSSTLGDGLSKNRMSSNGMKFSTYDRDNDGDSTTDCSNMFGEGGWWYKSCYLGANPTAPLGDSNNNYYIANWQFWDRENRRSIGLSEIQFKIRV